VKVASQLLVTWGDDRFAGNRGFWFSVKVAFPGVEQGQGERFAGEWLVREAQAGRCLVCGVDVAAAGGEEQAGDGEQFGMGDGVEPGAGVPGVSGADETQPVLPLAGQVRVP
jgi:hypothetical protein